MVHFLHYFNSTTYPQSKVVVSIKFQSGRKSKLTYLAVESCKMKIEKEKKNINAIRWVQM